MYTCIHSAYLKLYSYPPVLAEDEELPPCNTDRPIYVLKMISLDLCDYLYMLLPF